MVFLEVGMNVGVDFLVVGVKLGKDLVVYEKPDSLEKTVV